MVLFKLPGFSHEACFGFRILSLPASVCVCVCVSVCVRARQLIIENSFCMYVSISAIHEHAENIKHSWKTTRRNKKTRKFIFILMEPGTLSSQFSKKAQMIFMFGRFSRKYLHDMIDIHANYGYLWQCLKLRSVT